MTDWKAVEKHAKEQAKKLFPVSNPVMGELKRRFALTINLQGHYQDWKEIGIDNIINPPKEARYNLDNEEQRKRAEASQAVIAKQRSKRLKEKGNGGSAKQYQA